MSVPQVSFVVPSYNSKATLPLCLRAIADQKTSRPFEVLVVDSSDDETPDLLQPVFGDVKWLRLPDRTPPGTARNRGIEQCAAPVVAFVDSDVILESHWLERGMLRWDSEFAGICGAVEPYPERNPLGFCLFLIQFSKFLPIGSPRPLELVPSYAFLVRKTDALNAGGFPENFPVLEDILFSKRMADVSESPFLFCPDMNAFHVNRKEWRIIAGQLRVHGMWSARARRNADLPGKFLIRGRMAVPLLVPYRLLLILYRSWRWNLKAFVKGLILLPVLFCGLTLWARSFYQESAKYHA